MWLTPLFAVRRGPAWLNAIFARRTCIGLCRPTEDCPSKVWAGANRLTVPGLRLALLVSCVLLGLAGMLAAAPASVSVVDHGNFSSQVVVAGNPAIAYLSAGALKFARNAAADGSGAWTAVTVDAAGAQFPSLAVVEGTPAIAYCKS